MIRVLLPQHLQTLAGVRGEVTLEMQGRPTPCAVLDALEARYPMLRGTIRDHVTRQRRPFVRFFACQEDLSHQPPDTPLPEAVVTAAEPIFDHRGHCGRLAPNPESFTTELSIISGGEQVAAGAEMRGNYGFVANFAAERLVGWNSIRSLPTILLKEGSTREN